MINQEIVNRLSKTEHGFKPIEEEAFKQFNSLSPEKCFTIACQLLDNDMYQLRSLGVFLLGYLASKKEAALSILKEKVSCDPSWQVQEILAKAFDQYCKNTGYEKALPVIREWLEDNNPKVCRAVTEGLRIWTGRSYFKSHPDIAIRLISQHKAHESEYLRKSVGNALRDISKKHTGLVVQEISGWDLRDKKIQLTYKLAAKYIKAQDNIG